ARCALVQRNAAADPATLDPRPTRGGEASHGQGAHHWAPRPRGARNPGRAIPTGGHPAATTPWRS
ncbi:hypothetical protein, partial [Streptomyces scabiei]|uniref:hypothetical protein n=1 Tax=Streptomyces scabiei TaxID=1930 RepID=UPI001F42FAD1